MKLNLSCYFPVEPPFFTQIIFEGNLKVDLLLREFHKRLKEEVDYDVPLRDLVLYKADVKIEPEVDLTDRVIQWLRIQPEAAKLSVLRNIKDVFTEALPNDTLHIIVANAETKELLDFVDDPQARSRIQIKKSTSPPTCHLFNPHEFCRARQAVRQTIIQPLPICSCKER
ncbi:hypothetical protein SERLA73DRAFT_77275 [Serpula lacrymans var. lacrymans S7.3]|uniref:Uncharacterized protein n=1 Tax=Serpula lacrymans var. lacrymans (strain S7.3) TaxID=936435 RepID=F8Q9K9_SERL3|nr:hypothetical protein SERLA73DRAFT_77275 [Serpula lacrymans var. lacrymans S7.3]